MATDFKVYDGGLSKSAKNIAIGIDQSYTGFAFSVIDKDTGEYMVSVWKAPGNGVQRLYWIQEKLRNTLKLYTNAQTIVSAMEGYAYGSQVAHMAGELGAVVKLTLFESMEFYDARYPYIIPPTVLKKYVTGKGTGIQKNQMLLHVYKKWGAEFSDDNAADAYSLAHLVGGLGQNQYEVEIYDKIQDPKFRDKP